MLLRAISCLFVIINSFLLCTSKDMLGPANIVYKSFEHCDPPVTEVDMWVSQRKYNRTTNVLDIRISTPFALGDDIILDIQSSIKKEGGYKTGSFYIKDGFCKVLRTLLGDVFEGFLEINGLEDCPIPEGEYKISEFYLDAEKLTTPLLYGDYKVQSLILKEETVMGCYIGFIDVQPKNQ